MSPLRLSLDAEALKANWRALDRLSGTAACGAAVKADGYGLGAVAVARHLADTGCRDFFVATWREAEALAGQGFNISVLHGVREEDMAAALAGIARPVLNTAAQVARWRDASDGACDVMIDTGMNRLGLAAADVASGLLDGLTIDTAMSHLACADEDSPQNAMQRKRFMSVASGIDARRLSLANSAGIALGADYAFDLTRPGLALYGGVPCPALAEVIRRVVTPQAQVVQRRRIAAGEGVGYNATWHAPGPIEAAVVNIGYADGYARSFSSSGSASFDGLRLPVIGRVSMDLLTLDASAAPSLSEGDWVSIDFDLPEAAAASGLSQYELLTGLGQRFDRVWMS